MLRTAPLLLALAEHPDTDPGVLHTIAGKFTPQDRGLLLAHPNMPATAPLDAAGPDLHVRDLLTAARHPLISDARLLQLAQRCTATTLMHYLAAQAHVPEAIVRRYHDLTARDDNTPTRISARVLINHPSTSPDLRAAALTALARAGRLRAKDTTKALAGAAQLCPTTLQQVAGTAGDPKIADTLRRYAASGDPLTTWRNDVLTTLRTRTIADPIGTYAWCTDPVVALAVRDLDRTALRRQLAHPHVAATLFTTLVPDLLGRDDDDVHELYSLTSTTILQFADGPTRTAWVGAATRDWHLLDILDLGDIDTTLMDAAIDRIDQLQHGISAQRDVAQFVLPWSRVPAALRIAAHPVASAHARHWARDILQEGAVQVRGPHGELLDLLERIDADGYTTALASVPARWVLNPTFPHERAAGLAAARAHVGGLHSDDILALLTMQPVSGTTFAQHCAAARALTRA